MCERICAFTVSHFYPVSYFNSNDQLIHVLWSKHLFNNLLMNKQGFQSFVDLPIGIMGLLCVW